MGPKFTLGGPAHPCSPWRRNFCTISEYFTISNCVFNFSFLSLVLYEIVGWSQIYIRGRCTGSLPPGGKILILKASTPAYLTVFLISTFQLQQFPRYQGVPNLHQGDCAPLDALQRKNFYTQNEYFGISNCVFNFNFLALVVSEILKGFPNLHQGPTHP